MAYRILCVEDNPDIGRMLTKSLGDAGYQCEHVTDGESALTMLESGAIAPKYHLVVLDLMLPGLDGLEVCRRLRQGHSDTSVLMLTARAATHEVVLGLEIGADDYVTKPFHMPILLARVQALLRRHGNVNRDHDESAGMPKVVHGALVIDVDGHQATLAGTPLSLTAKEFALLALFARHPGHLFSRGELLDRVWGEEFDGYDHTVNTHINRLRNKVENDPAHPRFIQTVWGLGYRFAELEGHSS